MPIAGGRASQRNVTSISVKLVSAPKSSESNNSVRSAGEVLALVLHSALTLGLICPICYNGGPFAISLAATAVESAGRVAIAI